jgi:hypothetical protein
VGVVGGVPALVLSLGVLPAALFTAVRDERPNLTFKLAGMALAASVVTYLILLALK